MGWPPWAPPPLQASRQLKRTGARVIPLKEGFGEKVGWETQGCCLPEDWFSAASLTIMPAQGALEPRKDPFLACLPQGHGGGLSRTLPILPCGGGKARRVGRGLGEGWETLQGSEPSCSRASNSNHPDPSVNPNLLTLTAPDKGGLTNLNLPGGLAFSPSLSWSPVAQPPGVS